MNKIQLEELFKNFSQFKFVNVTQSNLGRKEPTITIYLSLDSKDTWINNIFFNSNYLILYYYNGKLECSSKHFSLPTFRKSSPTNPQKFQKLIQNYLQKITFT